MCAVRVSGVSVGVRYVSECGVCAACVSDVSVGVGVSVVWCECGVCTV